MASQLCQISETISDYFRDRKRNLSFFTTELQIYELFSKCGEVNKIIMGLNKNTKTPCGFCFVEYFNKNDALKAIDQLNNTYLDNRLIRVDLDMGFVEGRQFGRGYSGAQKRDELTEIEDPDRPRDNKFIGHKKRFRDDNYSRGNQDHSDKKYSFKRK